MRHAAWIVSAYVVLALGSCARGLDPGALVEHYVELHRSGDIDALLALNSDDAEFLIPGLGLSEARFQPGTQGRAYRWYVPRNL
jgi:ketosteroid isomerase-like protein